MTYSKQHGKSVTASVNDNQRISIRHGGLPEFHDREEDLCLRILALIRDVLYLDFRYFDRALAVLTPEKSDSLKTIATDGIRLYYSPEQLIRLYPANPLFLNRAMLHAVLHCIFRHPWLRNGGEPSVWNLSCDIAAEYLIDSFEKNSVKRILSGIRTQIYGDFDRDDLPVTASLIYQKLFQSADLPEDMSLCGFGFETLVREFYVDDHRFWPGDEKASPAVAQAAASWEQLGRRTDQDLSSKGKDRTEGAQNMITQIQKGRSRRSYHDFLNRFTVYREEMHVNPDEFDLGYYTYGLRLYGNLPLIESLESREIRKIQELVMVIDTSYSTSGSLVRKFLERTFEILQEKDHFFRKSRIHILQCDNEVRDHILVTSDEDVRRLLASFRLVGGGGTDFRPAFRYIRSKTEAGEMKDLQGILYFTDGKGIFPSAAPPRKTAFVFYGQQTPEQVPAWAYRVELTERELLRHRQG